MRILIAEDDRVTAKILTSLLTSWGHETTVASDGESALQMISASTRRISPCSTGCCRGWTGRKSAAARARAS